MQVFLTCKGSLHAPGLGDLPGSATRGLNWAGASAGGHLPVLQQPQSMVPSQVQTALTILPVNYVKLILMALTSLTKVEEAFWQYIAKSVSMSNITEA